MFCFTQRRQEGAQRRDVTIQKIRAVILFSAPIFTALRAFLAPLREIFFLSPHINKQHRQTHYSRKKIQCILLHFPRLPSFY